MHFVFYTVHLVFYNINLRIYKDFVIRHDHRIFIYVNL